MMAEWKEVKLEDISDSISYGYTASANESSVGPKFLRITDIQGGTVDWSKVPYCEIDDKNISKYLLQERDILIARTGNSTGENYLYRDRDNEKAVFASYLIRFRIDPQQADASFVWYNLRSDNWINFVIGAKTGSAQAGANAKVLGSFKLTLPSLEDQKSIADILTSLDHKIELNRQMNETLEAIAQALFKSWFVDFDPVRAKMEGQQPEGLSPEVAALFPDKLVDSPLGEIPEGWKIGKLGMITKIQGGFAFKSKDFKCLGNPVIKIKNINSDGSVNSLEVDFVSDEIAETAKRFALNDGDLLMAMTGATVGKFGLIVNYLEKKCLLNQRVARFTPNDGERPWFLYTALNHNSIISQIINTALGSAQPNISSDGIGITKLVLPDSHVMGAFNELLDSNFKKTIALRKEIYFLSQLRDTLLPKLISGELCIIDNVINIEDRLKQRAQQSCKEKGYVDIEKIAHEMGISILIDPSLKKGRIQIEDQSPTIYVKDKRDSFTIAHELAHYVRHPEEVKQYAVGRKDECSLLLQQEQEADALAAEILMPEEFVSDFLEEHGVKHGQKTLDQNLIKKCAKQFRVSEPAMHHRLSNLNYRVPYKKYTYVYS